MLNPALAAFLEEGLGIHIGSRDDTLAPNGARGAALRIEPDGRHLVVYLAEVAAARVLPDLQSNGLTAVSVARPTDDRAAQVKGTFVDARPARDDERPFIEAQWNRFLDKLEAIGISRTTAKGWIIWPAMAVRLRATAVFEQTPGPAAGTPVSADK
jgi:hypothetical protein